jgi:hypothetical protein
MGMTPASRNVRRNLRAELFLGKREGYDGDLRSTDEILDRMGLLQEEELRKRDEYIPFAAHSAEICYLDEKGTSMHEPCVVLIADRAPAQADEDPSFWKKRIEKYAAALAKEFAQVRVHVSYLEVETRVLER